MRFAVLFLIFFSFELFAYDVYVAKKDIGYKKMVKLSNLFFKKTDKLSKFCKPFDASILENESYYALHYISKGSIICTKDVEKHNRKSVRFNFGSLEIEKEGEIIYENEKFIKIRKFDGKIEKIYKDGRLK